MKKLLLLLVLVLFPLSVRAETLNADGNYHRINGVSISFSYSEEKPYCEIKSKQPSDADVTCVCQREKKVGYCDIKANNSVNLKFEYGTLDKMGNKVPQGTSSANFTKKGSSNSYNTTTHEDSTPAKIELSSFCDDSGVKVGFKIGGIIIMLIKIIVPILLIVFGMIDMSKAVVSDKQDAVKASAISFAKRAIAALLIFLTPTFVFDLFGLITQWTDIEKDYKACIDCLKDPNKCEGASLIKDIPKE